MQPMKPEPSNPSGPFPDETIPPEVLEWARQTFDEDAFCATSAKSRLPGACAWRTSSPNSKRG